MNILTAGTSVVLNRDATHILERSEHRIRLGTTGTVEVHEEGVFVGLLVDDLRRIPIETQKYNRYWGIPVNYVEISLDGEGPGLFEESVGRVPDWSEIIPRDLELPPGTAVTSVHLGKGILVSSKPLRLGWPQDGYVRWFVFSEDREWKASPLDKVYLDLESPSGFGHGLRVVRQGDDDCSSVWTKYDMDSIVDTHLLGKTTAACRLALASAIIEVTL